ncbi:MAG: SDR family oxidoreductase [Actinobacteria bacterium]|nr:SDR family oxidoreductase [Actinomycetota bacterium]
MVAEAWNLEGMGALVTGGASGIGLATAMLLAERGAQVAVLDRRVDELPSGMLGLTADVTDDDEVKKAVRATVDAFGGADILINNAGIGAQGSVSENVDEEWLAAFDVNVLGMVRVTRAALDHLRASERAAIVNTCSVAATVGLPKRALYSATKGAVQALTLAMAADHVGDGIRVNCVNPGTVDTPWVGRLLAAAPDPVAEREALVARQPIRRLVTAAEVAEAIVYLASPAALGTTGTSLAIDGGIHGLRVPVSP